MRYDLRAIIETPHVEPIFPSQDGAPARSHQTIGIVNPLTSWSMLLPTFEVLQGSPGGFLELPKEYVTIDMAARHDVALHSITAV